MKNTVKDDLFQELLESAKEGAAIVNGSARPSRTFELPETEVRALRNEFGLSQDKFARLVGISVGTLHNREQGRLRPEGPARVILNIASRHPEVLRSEQVNQSVPGPPKPARRRGKSERRGRAIYQSLTSARLPPEQQGRNPGTGADFG